MSKLYVFAIGGSGSRVLKSLTMLLAAGVDVDYDIVPMIIDTDGGNEDLRRTNSLMREYRTIHDSLKFGSDYKNKFFKSSFEPLDSENDTFLSPPIKAVGVSFKDFAGLDQMSRENQAMMRMLFSNENLETVMDQGFYGNPNIGSVVLNQFTETTDFKTFSNNFMDGDRVFIISSIFGGTGASGFPLLFKAMREDSNNALSHAVIGAVSLLPYFNLKPALGKSRIESDSFITKTKAALSYYEKNVTGDNEDVTDKIPLNDMYYLGDECDAVYENCDGGEGQKNMAHIIELLAALALVDFAAKPSNGNSRKTLFHEFGLQTDQPKGSISFKDFGPKTQKVICKPLSMMAIMNAYLNTRDVDHRVSQKWAKEQKEALGVNFWRSDKSLEHYCTFKKGFEEWVKELDENKMSFSPFRYDANDDVLDIIEGYTPHYGGLFSRLVKKGSDLIDKTLGDNISHLPKNMENFQMFMELFYVTIETLCKDKLNIE